MPNEFDELKNNQALRKFHLVRIEHARWISDAISSIGGGMYTYNAAELFVSRIEENGVAMQRVSGVPASGQYSVGSSGIVTLFPSSHFSNIVLFDYLFYTQEQYRVWNADPDDQSTPLVNWRPRISQSPSISQSIKNVLAGVFSISSTSIEIIDDERELDPFFGENDSFYKKTVDVWLCIESEENRKKIFSGRIASVSRADSKASFVVRDCFDALRDKALLGDTQDECHATIDKIPQLDPQKNGFAIRFFFGPASPYSLEIEQVSGLPEARKLSVEKLADAVCISYSQTISTSTNRVWRCGRTHALLDFSHQPASVDNSASSYTKIGASSAAIEKMRIGDTFVVSISGTDVYARVLHVDRQNNFYYTTKISGLSTSHTIQSNACPTIVVRQYDKEFLCLYGRDYTATASTTSGGNKSISITFTDNFESNHPEMQTLDPTRDSVFFRIKPVPLSHSDALKLLVERAGLQTGSFDTSHQYAKIAMSIPDIEETDYKNYIDYCKDILSSMLGFLWLDDDMRVCYSLFSAPTGGMTIDENDVVDGSRSVSYEYQDIATKIIAYNPHWNAEDVVAATGTSEASSKAEFLHGTKNVVRMKHCLTDISNRLGDILSLRSNRIAEYSFDVAHKMLAARLGDNVELFSKNAKIVEISNRKKNTTIKATDLLGL